MSKVLRRAFSDIINGYSVMKYHDSDIYIKHLSHKEHLDLEDLSFQYINEAREKGLPDEVSQLKYLKEQNLWNDRKEAAISSQKSYILNLKVNKKNILLPSVLESIYNQIKEAEKKLVELESEKRDLIGLTCETFSSRLVNEQYIYKSLYKDNKLTIPFFNSDEYNDLTDEELNYIVSKYNEILDVCSDDNIKKLSIQDFFQSYFYICNDDLYSFFGKPIVDFTYFQVKLSNNARYYKSLLENNDITTLPEHVKNDPDKLSDYLNTTKKGKDMIDNDSGQTSAIVGATKKDLEMLGVKQNKQNPREDLKEELKHFRG